MDAFDFGTASEVKVSVDQYCAEYASLDIPADRLDAARLTTAYVTFNGHVQRRFYEAKEDKEGRLVATEVQVPDTEAEQRLASAPPAP